MALGRIRISKSRSSKVSSRYKLLSRLCAAIVECASKLLCVCVFGRRYILYIGGEDEALASTKKNIIYIVNCFAREVYILGIEKFFLAKGDYTA